MGVGAAETFDGLPLPSPPTVNLSNEAIVERIAVICRR